MLLAIVMIAGCQEKNKDAMAPKAGAESPVTPADYRALGEFPHLCLDRPSAYDILNSGDLCHFQEGVDLSVIMEKINWRGNFEYSTIIDNEAVTGIGFRYSVADPEGLHGPNILAIFKDYRFLKFTEYPNPSEKSLIRFSELREALAAPAVSPIELWEKYTERYKRLVESAAAEPGIEIQSMILGPMLKAFLSKSGKDSASFADYKKNVELRDQFNASRLRLGMTSIQIMAALKCDQSLAIGQIDGMKYEIYGSTAYIDKMSSYIHFQNVMVIFNDDKATGIYGVFEGPRGIDVMHEQYPELHRIR
jgi:hypothetical protein